MKLKELQALEYFIFGVNQNKKLVVSYNGKLVSANFLSYGKHEGMSAETFVKKDYTDNLSSLTVSDTDFFAPASIEKILRTNQIGDWIADIDGVRFTLNAEKEIGGQLLSTIAHHIENFQGDDLKVLDTIPNDVNFLETGVHLPYYLFSENDDFTLVSVIDREEDVK